MDGESEFRSEDCSAELQEDADGNEEGESAQDEAEDALVRLSCRKDCERLRLRRDELANDGNILVDGIEELRAEANGDGRKPQDGANVSMWRSIARLAFEEHGKRKQGDTG